LAWQVMVANKPSVARADVNFDMMNGIV